MLSKSRIIIDIPKKSRVINFVIIKKCEKNIYCIQTFET